MKNVEMLENYRREWMRNIDVHLMITEQCNYFCRHCLLGDRQGVADRRLAYQVIDGLLEIGNTRLVFNGGEVFTFPGLEEIARYAHSSVNTHIK